MSTSVTAIIPAYNEQTTIGNIVTVARAHPAVSEVIVVDDGSLDQTVQRAQAAGATVIRHGKNQGKAQAMQTGTQAAREASHFLFLDADLLGLTREHIDRLLEPFDRPEAKLLAPSTTRSLASDAAMVVGIRDRGRLLTALNVHILPWISGERLVAKTLWDAVPREFKRGYKIELGLNATARRLHLRTVPVVLRGLTIRRKEQKVGLARGLWQRALMSRELIATIVRIMVR